jgi:hypothetical protein
MARYIPGNVADPQIAAELAKIAQAMETSDPFITLDTLYAAPNKYREGTIVKADGAVWNPGSGAGVYCRRGGSWTFLG